MAEEVKVLSREASDWSSILGSPCKNVQSDGAHPQTQHPYSKTEAGESSRCSQDSQPRAYSTTETRASLSQQGGRSRL